MFQSPLNELTRNSFVWKESNGCGSNIGRGKHGEKRNDWNEEQKKSLSADQLGYLKTAWENKKEGKGLGSSNELTKSAVIWNGNISTGRNITLGNHCRDEYWKWWEAQRNIQRICIIYVAAIYKKYQKKRRQKLKTRCWSKLRVKK